MVKVIATNGSWFKLSL